MHIVHLFQRQSIHQCQRQTINIIQKLILYYNETDIRWEIILRVYIIIYVFTNCRRMKLFNFLQLITILLSLVIFVKLIVNFLSLIDKSKLTVIDIVN